jgi:hypothetical protein
VASREARDQGKAEAAANGEETVQELDVQLNRYPKIYAALCRVMGDLPGVDNITISYGLFNEVSILVTLVSKPIFRGFMINLDIESMEQSQIDSIVSANFAHCLEYFKPKPPGRGAAWSREDDRC